MKYNISIVFLVVRKCSNINIGNENENLEGRKYAQVIYVNCLRIFKRLIEQ